MARQRVPGYITKQSSNDFGLDVRVQDRVKTPNTSPGLYPSGEPVPAGQTGLGDPPVGPFPKAYRDVIPPGVIGSNEGEDLDKLGLPQYIDTVAYSSQETRPPALHGAKDSLSTANRDVPFNAYATFQPRSAPMPRAAQDQTYLERYNDQSAGPQMTDEDSTSPRGSRDSNRLDLNAPNRDGVIKARG